MALSRLHDAHSSTATAGHAGRSTRSERAVDAPRLRRPRLLHRNQPATRFHWCTFQRPKPAHISTPLETRPRADPGGGGRVLHRVQLDKAVRGGSAEGVASAEKQTGSARTARTRPSTRRLPLKQLTPRGLRDRAERILAMPDRRSQRYSNRPYFERGSGSNLVPLRFQNADFRFQNGHFRFQNGTRERIKANDFASERFKE